MLQFQPEVSEVTVMNFAKVEYHTTTLQYQLYDNRDNKETECKDLTCFP